MAAVRRENPRGGRSIADPVFDPVWARIDEAQVRVATHVGPTDYQKYGADLSEDPEAVLGDFDGPPAPRSLEITGPYAREMLAELIESRGARIASFDSYEREGRRLYDLVLVENPRD